MLDSRFDACHPAALPAEKGCGPAPTPQPRPGRLGPSPRRPAIGAVRRPLRPVVALGHDAAAHP